MERGTPPCEFSWVLSGTQLFDNPLGSWWSTKKLESNPRGRQWFNHTKMQDVRTRSVPKELYCHCYVDKLRRNHDTSRMTISH